MVNFKEEIAKLIAAEVTDLLVEAILKNENKVNSKSNTTISGNKLGLSSSKSEGNVEFKTHDIGFKSNKTTYFHKRKASYAQLYSATNKNVGENTIDVVAEIITINY